MDALYTAPIPLRLSFDDLVRISVALDHHRQIFEATGETDEAAAYQETINRVEQAARPTLAIMAEVSR